MGLSEYLAGDLALLDDPDLAEDEADLVRDLEHFRRQQQAERAVRRAARQVEEMSGASASRRQLPDGGGGGGSHPSSSARPAPVELDLSRHELSCVDETRFFDDPLDLGSSPAPAAPVAPVARSSPDRPSANNTTDRRHFEHSSDVGPSSLAYAAETLVPADTPVPAPRRPTHPLATSTTAPSSSPPAPVITVCRRSNGQLEQLGERSLTSYSLFRATVTQGSTLSTPAEPRQHDGPRPGDLPSHLHSSGARPAGLLPRTLADHTLSRLIDAHDPWTKKRVAPLVAEVSAAATPGRLTSFASSPTTPGPAGPSTYAQFEGLNNVTSPSDSILEFSPTQAQPPLPRATSRTGKGKATTIPAAAKPMSRTKAKLLAFQQKAWTSNGSTSNLAAVPEKRAPATTATSPPGKKPRKKAPPVKAPPMRRITEYAAELNALLLADVERSSRIFSSPVVLDGSQEATAEEIARLTLRGVLKGVGVYLVWSGNTVVNHFQRAWLDKISALGAEVIDAHDSPRVTHVVLCAPKEPKDILVRFGAKDDATLKQGSRKDVAFVKDGWINACLEDKQRVEEDPYLVFILHKRVYDGIRARTMRLATSGATAAQASAAGSSDLEVSAASYKAPDAGAISTTGSTSTTGDTACPARPPETSSMTGGTAAQGDALERFIRETEPAAAFEADMSSDDEASVVGVADPAAERALLKQLRAERRAKLQRQGGTWACMRSAPFEKTDEPIGVNARIIEEFQRLAAIYEAQAGDNGFHSGSYRRVAQAIRAYPKQIESRAEALQIRGVGQRQADKIDEIIKTGGTARLVLEEQDPRNLAVQAMSKIYGVGLVRANQLYEAGARGIDQLRNEPERFPLSTASRIGLAIYEDLLERIPRDEVAAIGEVVKAAAREIAPGDDAISIEVMGSFRRGAADCGDVDFLITRDTADGKTHAGLLDKLLLFLRSSGFLTHDLSLSMEGSALEMKYFGTCRLSPAHKHRRIDILTIPFNQWGGALIYFTGNDHFNRSLRKLAGTKGLRLNQRGLFERASKGLQHGAEDLEPLASRTEQEIFDALGVRWRPPTERNC